MNDSRHSDRTPTARSLRAVAEFLLFTLVALSPWPLGAVEARWQFALSGIVFVLLTLWAAHAVLTGRFAYRADVLSVCLTGLVLVTALQLIPLPPTVVNAISPTTAELHRTLIPETPELLPSEGEADVPRRSGWVRLSLAPAETENLLAQLLTVFLVYSCARNFAARSTSLRRLAWVGLAVGVLLSLAGMVKYLGSTPQERISGGFGPFLNKNHFAFQVLLFAGLAIGLFFLEVRNRGVKSPQAIGVLAGIGLMIAAVGFSQSRGGVLAALGAGLITGLVVATTGSRGVTRRAGLTLLAGVTVVAISLTVWLGWRGVTERIATLWSGEADNRTADWRVGLRLAEKFWATGVGGGALSTAEPLVRTRSDQPYEYNTLDNEYLEALVEGGIVRFGLTVALALAAVVVAFSGYRRLADRSAGPLLLGCAFGLTAVALQSLIDFGLHIPSVALTACIIAAFAVAACRPPEPETTPYATPRPALTYTAAAAVFVLVGFLLVLVNWRAERVVRLQKAADALLQSDSPQRHEPAIRYLEAATRLRPNDATVWRDLSAAHFAAAAELQTRALGSVAGPLAFAWPPVSLPVHDPGGHIAAGLRAARTARNLQPTLREPHVLLGLFADRFARSEPPTAHFSRAKVVAGFDPDVWLASGTAAADRGDWSSALHDWREALLRSPKRLPVVARAAAGRVPSKRFRADGLPDDPALWFAATRFLFPSSSDPARLEWLKITANSFETRAEPSTTEGFAAWGATLHELGDLHGELRVLRRAVEVFPDDIHTRDRLARCLDAEELYDEATPVLEWLVAQQPDDAEVRERLAAARHALQLRADIDRK